MNIERREFSVEKLTVEVRENAPPVIRGHAAVFNHRSEVLGSGSTRFREQIAPGAFAEALRSGDPVALVNHKSELILGRLSAGTLRAREDEIGLAIEIDAPETQYARDLVVSINRGDIRGMSFGFSVSKEGQAWERGSDGISLRTIRSVSALNDVSPVTFPAYPQTDIAVRELRDWESATQAADQESRRRRMRMRLALRQRQLTA
jgi:HK97 family phage prohead protease